MVNYECNMNILLFVFLFLMPIVLMNLMIKDGCIMSSVVYVGSVNVGYRCIMFTVLYIWSVDVKYGCIMFTVLYIGSVDVNMGALCLQCFTLGL